MLRHVDELELVANLTVDAHDVCTGRLVAVAKAHNLVLLAARNGVRDAFNGIVTDITVTDFAFGIGATPPAAADLALESEVLRDVVTSRTPDVASLTLKYYMAAGQANGSTLTEAGLLTAGGVLLARVVHNPIAKTASLTLTYSWVLTIGAG